MYLALSVDVVPRNTPLPCDILQACINWHRTRSNAVTAVKMEAVSPRAPSSPEGNAGGGYENGEVVQRQNARMKKGQNIDVFARGQGNPGTQVKLKTKYKDKVPAFGKIIFFRQQVRPIHSHGCQSPWLASTR